jgi:heterodisulfide reductase subunit A
VRLSTEVRAVSGFVGNFRVRLGPASDSGDSASSPEAEPEREFGAIVLASGAESYVPQPDELGYGRFKNVITALDLERRLADPRGLQGVRNVAFIQCVGSRRGSGAHSNLPGQSGCSRVCCAVTVRQARELRQRGISRLVCYRDMRTVSQGAEEAYREARNEGVVFLRFHEDDPPSVRGREDLATEILAHETLLRRDVVADVNLIVLATGLVPRDREARRLQEMLKTPRGSDGFFLERHPELSPVETCVDGVVLCGTGQGPKDLADSLAQASAAAMKAAALLAHRALHLEPTVAIVDFERCRGCEQCVNLCDFRAPQMVVAGTGARVAEINAALCKGCGTCAVWCPTGAIAARHFRDGQITAMIDSLFATGAGR